MIEIQQLYEKYLDSSGVSTDTRKQARFSQRFEIQESMETGSDRRLQTVSSRYTLSCNAAIGFCHGSIEEGKVDALWSLALFRMV